jgi:hypothetical protein
MSDTGYSSNQNEPTFNVSNQKVEDLTRMIGEVTRGVRSLSNEIKQHPVETPQAYPSGLDIRVDVYRARRLRLMRRKLFGDGVYCGPAWDILLHLFESYVFQRRDTVGSVKDGAELAGTTAVRWIDRLEEEGLISSHGDHLDGRRRFVELSGSGLDLMTKYFAGAAPHQIAA